jgi:uncharacterized protein
VLADLQTDRVGAYEWGAIERLMALKPDVILIPGDIFQGTDEEWERQRPEMRRLLASLSAPGGVYYTQGDVDGGDEEIADLMEGTGIRPLINEIARVSVGDRPITIGGLELAYRSPGALATIRELERAKGRSDLRILVAHRPDAAMELTNESRVDLVVAGHTHGGQIVLPFFGPPMTLTGVPRAMAAGGLHRLFGNALYVSRGVGCERGRAPRIRFLCPPEISLITIGSCR